MANLPAIRLTAVLGNTALDIWSGGFVRFDRHPTNHRHRHSTYHEICLATAGRGEFRHGGSTYALRTGDLFLSNMDVPHEISSFRTHDLELVFLCFAVAPVDGPAPENPEAHVVARFLAGHAVHCRSEGRLDPWLAVMCDSAHGLFGAHKRETAARLFVFEAMDLLALFPDPDVSRPAEPDAFARAVEFIERNVRRQFTVEELARHCACSSRQLRRLFTERAGRRLMDSVNERRMRLAAQDLLMRFTVGQVAEAFGFASAAHFTRLFARYHGVTPKRYQLRFAPKGAIPKTDFGE
jgi:AraC-like DNA-binding protein/mannose-6-phosphate isomerase-like protein (cupin superfamily)